MWVTEKKCSVGVFSLYIASTAAANRMHIKNYLWKAVHLYLVHLYCYKNSDSVNYKQHMKKNIREIHTHETLTSSSVNWWTNGARNPIPEEYRIEQRAMCRCLWFRTKPSEKTHVSSIGSTLARQPHAQSIARRKTDLVGRKNRSSRSGVATDKMRWEPPGIRWEASQLTHQYIYM